ncbi:hypothetical protein HAX54_019058, partial [Datura stramonium]|nr:hypothetical protein [Datura stramonium]
SLDSSNKSIIKNLARGALMDQTFEFSNVLLENVAKTSHAWGAWGTKGYLRKHALRAGKER